MTQTTTHTRSPAYTYADAHARLAAEDLAGASEIWRQLGEHNNDPLAWTEHGRILVQQGQTQAAQTAFERALTIEPNYLLAHRLLGWVATEERDWRSAAARWRKVLQLGTRQAALAEQSHQPAPTELSELPRFH